MNSLTLNNGLRVVYAPSPTNTVYLGLALDAGTRDEKDGESGMAHFAEHQGGKDREAGLKRKTNRPSPSLRPSSPNLEGQSKKKCPSTLSP